MAKSKKRQMMNDEEMDPQMMKRKKRMPMTNREPDRNDPKSQMKKKPGKKK